MAADAEEQSEVDAEGPDIGTGLARDPEDAEVAVVVKLDELAVVNGADAELTLDGRDEGRALEQGAGQGLDRAAELLLRVEGAVEAEDADVFLACALLTLDEAGGAVDADGEAAGDLGVEGARVTCLFAPEDAADPRDDLVRGGVRGLVEVDDAELDVRLEVALQRGRAGGDGRKVGTCGPGGSVWVGAPLSAVGARHTADEELVIVLEEEGPVLGVELGRRSLGLDGEPGMGEVSLLAKEAGTRKSRWNSLSKGLSGGHCSNRESSRSGEAGWEGGKREEEEGSEE